jgi:iron(III) transport system substrate-binding protein
MKMNKISLSISTALLAAGFMTSSAVIAQAHKVIVLRYYWLK